MTRQEKFNQILEKALLVFPVFKFTNKKQGPIKLPKLTILQFITLMFVRHSPKENGEPMNIISSFLGISKQQTTKLIDSLVEMGLINRSWNPESRREILITIKPEGITLLDEMQKDREKEFALRLSKLTEEETDTLYNHIIQAYELFKKAEY